MVGACAARTIASVDVGAEGAGTGTRVLCVFLDAPVGTSTGSVRWRHLAKYVCSRGTATVVVVHHTDPDDLAMLSAELGADVVSLDVAQDERWRGVARAVAMPWRSWPPTRTDVGAARKAIAGQAGTALPATTGCDADAMVTSMRLTRRGLRYAPLHLEHYVFVGAPRLLKKMPLRCGGCARIARCW